MMLSYKYSQTGIAYFNTFCNATHSFLVRLCYCELIREIEH